MFVLISVCVASHVSQILVNFLTMESPPQELTEAITKNFPPPTLFPYCQAIKKEEPTTQHTLAFRPSTWMLMMPNLQIGAPSLHGFLQQPIVEPRSPTPSDAPVTSWAPNSTLMQYYPNSHKNGCVDSSNGTVFFRLHQDWDNSTTPRHHIVVLGLNFVEISHG